MSGRRLLLAGSFALSLLLVRPGIALSPPDQYATFDRATTVIQDRYTGLVWQRTVTAPSLKADAAAAYCDGLTLDEASDFRLPTYLELASLVDDVPHSILEEGRLVPRAIDPNAFPDTPAREFWASDVVVDPVLADTQRWSVDFATGTSAPRSKDQGLLVRCVRSSAP